MKQTAAYRLSSYILFSAVCLFVMFLQFYRLGELAIVQWDESRLAVNAAEMYHSGNYLITSYEGLPDLYNTKPPLMIWLQVLSIHLFGLNELAIRFPAATAGFLCILLCGRIGYRYRKNLYHASLIMMLLACSKGFIQLHGSLTGDYDALLSLFLLAAFYHFYEGFFRRYKLRHQLYFTLFLAWAIMCKSAAAFIAFPVFIMALLPGKSLRSIFRCGLFCALSILPFAIYCLLRGNTSPGYMEAIMANDFGGRLSKALEGHTSEWHYYIVNLFDYRFHYFIWLLPVAIVAGYVIDDKYLRYYTAASVGFLIMVSIPQTRIHWYDMPALPLIAISIGILLIILFSRIRNRYAKIAYICILCSALLVPAAEKFRFIAARDAFGLDTGHYELSDMLRKKKGKENMKYIAAQYDAEFYFYTHARPDIQRGYFRSLLPGDTVAMGNLYKDSIREHYNYILLDSTQNAKKIRITGIK